MTTDFRKAAPQVFRMTAAAAGLVLVAVVLYATELSRATAMAILPFALLLFGSIAFALKRGHWPARTWPLAFGLLSITALAYGIGLYVYAQLHPPLPV